MRLIAALSVAFLALVTGPTTAACPPRQAVKFVKAEKKDVAAVVVEKKVVSTEFEVVTEVSAATVRTVRVSRPTAVIEEVRRITFRP